MIHYSPCVLLFHTPTPPQSSPITSIRMLALRVWGGGGGGGATDSQVTAGGTWDEEEPPAHISVLEFRAAYLALQSLCKHCLDSHVCLYMDKSTAVSYINKKGGTHSVLCNALAVEIWQCAIPRNIWLSAAFIPGESNVVADFYSRCPNDNTEWQLNPTLFEQIVRGSTSPCH